MTRKKKVLTITFHRANNYGASLQSLALQKVLLNNNYDSKIIDYDNYKISDHYRILKKDRSNLFRFLIHIIPRLYRINAEFKKEKSFDSFRSELKMTQYYSSIKSLKSNPPKCDVLICGSDQVWNPVITNGLDYAYFLQFGDDRTKKIAYAASCGTSKNIDDVNLFKSYLKKIDCISVRETELQEFIIKKKIANNVPTVLDPTLLLSRQDWESLINKERIEKEKYIFTYCVGKVDDLYYDTINYLATKLNLKIIYFDKMSSKIRVHKKSYYHVDPKDFLNLIYYSEFVITTSFHGFALSTVLNKKIFAILSAYPDRLISLAGKIQTEKFFVKKKSDIEKVLNTSIDWSTINNRIEMERSNSSKWLLAAIEGSTE